LALRRCASCDRLCGDVKSLDVIGIRLGSPRQRSHVQANAAQASRASLEALFQLPHSDTMIDGVYDAMRKSMSQMFVQNSRKGNASAARQRIEAKAMDDTMALVRAEYNWAVIEPDMIDAYQKTFTEEEVTAMINFYLRISAHRGRHFRLIVDGVSAGSWTAFQSDRGRRFSEIVDERGCAQVIH